MAKNVAVLLAGCGHLDGSEIREAMATLNALSKAGANVSMFSFDRPQKDVVNTLSGSPAQGETRNMMVEAARIARGDVKSMDQLQVSSFDALIIPGGFGVAKNFCTFAFDGPKGDVDSEIQKVLDGFYEAGKPIGALCIAPALLALAFPKKGFSLTVGPASDVATAIESLGHQHTQTKTHECLVDSKNKIVTTSAYMVDEAPIHEVFEGVEKTINSVIEMA